MNKVIFSGYVKQNPFISENFALVEIETTEEINGHQEKNIHRVKILKSGIEFVKKNIQEGVYVEFEGKQINDKNRKGNIEIGFIRIV